MNTKTVYLYDWQGHYSCEHILNERDDMTPVTKEWIIPANSTEVPMTLEEKEHYLPRWNGEAWGYEEDKNNPPIPEPPTPTPEEEKQRKITALDSRFASEKNEVLMYYLDALLNNDADEQAACQTDIRNLEEQYDTDYAAILNGEDE